jgi:hypothetical protein
VSRVVSRAQWDEYQRAKKAKSDWTAEEKRLKAEIAEDLGYDPDDPKPPPDDVVDEDGELIGQVKVTPGRRIDQRYLKDHYPAECAESEVVSYAVSFVAAKREQ